MAVLPMKRITVYGLKKDRKAVLEAIQRMGTVEIRDAGDDLNKVDTASFQATFLKASNQARSALEILSKYVPKKSSIFASLEGRKELSEKTYYGFMDSIDEIGRIASGIISLSKGIAEKKAEIVRAQSQIEMLSPWMSLSVPLGFKGTKKTAGFIGSFEGEKTIDELYGIFSKTQNDSISVDIDIVSSMPEMTCVLVICGKKDADKTEAILRDAGFMRPQVSALGIPAEQEKFLKEQIEKLQEEIVQAENEIKDFDGTENALKFMADYYTMRYDKYQALSQVGDLKKTFVITGYVPEKDAEKLEMHLSRKYNAAVEIEAVRDDEKAPVLLKNNGFSAPVESVIESYSMPGKGDIDPTTVMSIFYYILFGMMLSDFAYGLIVSLGCFWAIRKFKGMEDGLKNSLKMFMICGISTMFWGLMFGGCFGDAFTVISETYFGKTVKFPMLWCDPLSSSMQVLITSFAIGIVHLFTGLGIKFYQCVKKGEYFDAIYDVIFWYLLVGGGIAFLLSTEMFCNMAGLSFRLSPQGAKIAAICAGIGAVGIVLTAGRSSKNVGKRLAKGAYELYGVTSYLSDILSYSRLLALGLSTGVIAQVFNKMGAMVSNAVGDGIIGFVLFLVVFLVGHTLNIGINLLGTYVHTNRLQFVEFFGKFYEGGGEKFNPLKSNTKYYKIKEDF